MRRTCLGHNVQAGSIIVGVLEIDVTGNEVVLHHQHGVNELRSTSHPHLVSRLALGRGHRHTVVAKNAGDGLRLPCVTYAGRSSMGIDIAYISRCQSGVTETQFQRTGRSFYIGCRNGVAIAGESTTDNLCHDGSHALLRMFQAFQHQCSGTATGHQSVTVAGERPACPTGVVLTHGERLDDVEG